MTSLVIRTDTQTHRQTDTQKHRQTDATERITTATLAEITTKKTWKDGYVVFRAEAG